MKKNSKIIIILITSLAVIATLLVIVLNVFNKEKNYNADFINYETELLKIDFNDYVENSFGDIVKEDGKEDYAYLVFEIKEEKVEELKKELEMKMSNYSDRYKEMVKKYPTMNFVKRTISDLDNKDILEVYQKFLTGKVAHSREIIVFLCKDVNNYYLYIYG